MGSIGTLTNNQLNVSPKKTGSDYATVIRQQRAEEQEHLKSITKATNLRDAWTNLTQELNGVNYDANIENSGGIQIINVKVNNYNTPAGTTLSEADIINRLKAMGFKSAGRMRWYWTDH